MRLDAGLRYDVAAKLIFTCPWIQANFTKGQIRLKLRYLLDASFGLHFILLGFRDRIRDALSYNGNSWKALSFVEHVLVQMNMC